MKNDECRCDCKNPKERNAYEKIIFKIVVHVVVEMLKI